MYSGAVYPGMRDPSLFLDYLITLVNVNFKFIVYVPCSKIFEDYQKMLGDKLEIRKVHWKGKINKNSEYYGFSYKYK